MIIVIAIVVFVILAAINQSHRNSVAHSNELAIKRQRKAAKKNRRSR